MSGPDSAASAALGESVLYPCWVGLLDFDGDPVAVTTAPYDVTFSGTGDPELDGVTFMAANPDMIDVSEVRHQEQGSDTVTATLSGLAGIDTELLNILGNPPLWRGRTSALWIMLYDVNLQRIGNVWRYYTGTMVAAPIKGDPTEQVVEILIESYLANLSEASNRTYLDQEDFDPGDKSAEAAIAIANGSEGAGLRDSGYSYGVGGIGGGGRFSPRFNYSAL
ncbi:MAG: hypothetical protein ABJP02_04860 [Parasphingorhabdus sp.]|uniref:hypothetical protein n=1 Tax=Parasphingorhabdus sp. TaxID=2709688 RepID=UPI003296A63F